MLYVTDKLFLADMLVICSYFIVLVYHKHLLLFKYLGKVNAALLHSPAS